MGKNTKRLFLSIPLPDPLVQKLQVFQKSYRADLPQDVPLKKLRWTAPSDLHITVFFLGKTGTTALSLLQRKIAEVMATQLPFALRFRSVCYAPPGGKKRMIWAKFSAPSEFVQLVFEIYEKLSDDFGFQAPRKKLIPHATLARFKKVHRSDLPALDQPNVEQTIPVDGCELWESKLTNQGATYERLSNFSFGHTKPTTPG